MKYGKIGAIRNSLHAIHLTLFPAFGHLTVSTGRGSLCDLCGGRLCSCCGNLIHLKSDGTPESWVSLELQRIAWKWASMIHACIIWVWQGTLDQDQPLKTASSNPEKTKIAETFDPLCHTCHLHLEMSSCIYGRPSFL